MAQGTPAKCTPAKCTPAPAQGLRRAAAVRDGVPPPQGPRTARARYVAESGFHPGALMIAALGPTAGAAVMGMLTYALRAGL